MRINIEKIKIIIKSSWERRNFLEKVMKWEIIVEEELIMNKKNPQNRKNTRINSKIIKSTP